MSGIPGDSQADPVGHPHDELFSALGWRAESPSSPSAFVPKATAVRLGKYVFKKRAEELEVEREAAMLDERLLEAEFTLRERAHGLELAQEIADAGRGKDPNVWKIQQAIANYNNWLKDASKRKNKWDKGRQITHEQIRQATDEEELKSVRRSIGARRKTIKHRRTPFELNLPDGVQDLTSWGIIKRKKTV